MFVCRFFALCLDLGKCLIYKAYIVIFFAMDDMVKAAEETTESPISMQPSSLGQDRFKVVKLKMRNGERYDFRDLTANNPIVRKAFEKCESFQDKLRCIRRFGSMCTFVSDFASIRHASDSARENITASLCKTLKISNATPARIDRLISVDVPIESAEPGVLPQGVEVLLCASALRPFRDACLRDLKEFFDQTMNQGLTLPWLVVDRGITMRMNKKDCSCGPRFLYRTKGMQKSVVDYLMEAGYKALSSMVVACIDEMCKHNTELTPAGVLEGNSIVFIHYEPHVGIASHVDNVTYTEGGPIYAFGLGPPTSYFDLIPAVVDGTPVRLEVHELDAVCLSGESRFQWTHAIPYGCNYEKYTILFRTNTLEKRWAYDPFLQIHLPSTTGTQMAGTMTLRDDKFKPKAGYVTLSKADRIRVEFNDFWRMRQSKPTLALLCSDEETRHITRPFDSLHLCNAVRDIVASWPCKPHFIDAFACVGSDSMVMSSYSSEHLFSDILCIQTANAEEGRFRRLQHNTGLISCNVPILTFCMDVSQFLKTYSRVFGTTACVLYMDPPWDENIPKYINEKVIGPWKQHGWPTPGLVCLKTPEIIKNMAEFLSKQLGGVGKGKYKCAGHQHPRSRFYFSLYVFHKQVGDEAKLQK